MLVVLALLGILLVAFAVLGWIWLQVNRKDLSLDAVPVADVKTMQPLPIVPAVALEKELREAQAEIALVHEKYRQEAAATAEMVVELRRKNDGLKEELEVLLKARKNDPDLKVRVDEAFAEVRRLHEATLQLEVENARLKALSDAAAGGEELLRRAKEEYQHKTETFFKEIEVLREENTHLQALAQAGARAEEFRQAADEVSGRLRELEAVNAIQAEKNEYLQYELTKSRAQVVGLERLCENVPAIRPLVGRDLNENMPAGRG